MEKLLLSIITALTLSSCTVNHYHYTLPNEVIITTSQPIENPYKYVPSILKDTGKPFEYRPSSNSNQSLSDTLNTNQQTNNSIDSNNGFKVETNKKTSTTERTIYTGPRGGRYYINSNGNKTYIRKK